MRWISDESSVSLPLLPRGVPSLESHSSSSPFTHHEEKIQNMRCASLISPMTSLLISCMHTCISWPKCHLKETVHLWSDAHWWDNSMLLFVTKSTQTVFLLCITWKKIYISAQSVFKWRAIIYLYSFYLLFQMTCIFTLLALVLTYRHFCLLCLKLQIKKEKVHLYLTCINVSMSTRLVNRRHLLLFTCCHGELCIGSQRWLNKRIRMFRIQSFPSEG